MALLSVVVVSAASEVPVALPDTLMVAPPTAAVVVGYAAPLALISNGSD